MARPARTDDASLTPKDLGVGGTGARGRCDPLRGTPECGDQEDGLLLSVAAQSDP